MLSTSALIVSCLFVPLLLLALYSILTRELPPKTGLFGRLYQIQPGFFLVTNLFLAITFLSVVLRVAFHFEVLDKGLMDSAKFFIGMPVLAFLLLFLGLFVTAALRLYRQS